MTRDDRNDCFVILPSDFDLSETWVDPRDAVRRPGLCKVYNPDMTLREVLDPLTRKPVQA